MTRAALAGQADALGTILGVLAVASLVALMGTTIYDVRRRRPGERPIATSQYQQLIREVLRRPIETIGMTGHFGARRSSRHDRTGTRASAPSRAGSSGG